MKTLSTIFFGLALSVSVHAETSSQATQRLLSAFESGSLVDVAEMSGGYTGTCYVTYKTLNSSNEDYTVIAKEALYVGNFLNSDNKNVDLAISTEQTHGEITIPKELSFLLKADAKGLKFIQAMIANGETGIDNNWGRIAAGSDFTYNYVSKIKNNALVVTTEKLMDCREDRALCSPPTLQGCGYQRSEGGFVYENCLRNDDQTSFKKISDKKIVSHRTASSYGNPMNNYSFYLPAVSSVCEWEKK